MEKLCGCGLSLCVCKRSLCVCKRSLCVCERSLCVCERSLCVCELSLCVCELSLCVWGPPSGDRRGTSGSARVEIPRNLEVPVVPRNRNFRWFPEIKTKRYQVSPHGSLVELRSLAAAAGTARPFHSTSNVCIAMPCVSPVPRVRVEEFDTTTEGGSSGTDGPIQISTRQNSEKPRHHFENAHLGRLCTLLDWPSRAVPVRRLTLECDSKALGGSRQERAESTG